MNEEASFTSEIQFHFYKKSGYVAAEIINEFPGALSEMLFFGLMASRSFNKFRETSIKTSTQAEQLIQWIGRFGELYHHDLLDVEIIRRALTLDYLAEFNGIPGDIQLSATMTTSGAPNSLKPYYRFDIAEKGRFGLLGLGKHLQYLSALLCLWWFLINRRGLDVEYTRYLNGVGLGVGKYLLDGKLSPHTERDCVESSVYLARGCFC